MRTFVKFTLEVEINDAAALYDAASKHPDAADAADADLRDADGEIDVAACVQMLADPGASYPGCRIIESFATVDHEESDGA